MNIKTISTGFHASHLFDGWDSDDVVRYDERASAEKYQELYAQALREMYPASEVTVGVSYGTGGVLPYDLQTRINDYIDGASACGDEIFDIEIVDEIGSRVYSDFEWLVARPFISTATAGRQFDVPRATLTWACREGKISDAIKNGNRWEFPLESFLDWHNSRSKCLDCGTITNVRMSRTVGGGQVWLCPTCQTEREEIARR